MTEIQTWFDQLHPMLKFLTMGGIFLFTGVFGWYVTDIFLWLIGRK